MPRYARSPTKQCLSSSGGRAGDAASSSSTLLTNTNLFTLSAAPHHRTHLASCLEFYSGVDVTGFSDPTLCERESEDISASSRYGHRTELELRPQLLDRVDIMASSSSSNSYGSSNGRMDCPSAFSDAALAAAASVVDGASSGTMETINTMLRNAIAPLSCKKAAITFSSDSKCYGQGFVASLLNGTAGGRGGLEIHDTTVDDSEDAGGRQLQTLSNNDSTTGMHVSTSDDHSGDGRAAAKNTRLNSDCLSSSTSGTAVAREASLMSVCPLLRQIEALGELIETEVSSVRSYYGFGPNGAQKRPRVVSDADRIHAATAVGSEAQPPHPLVISKRTLLTDFSIQGGPSATVVGTSSSALAGSQVSGVSGAAAVAGAALTSPTSPLGGSNSAANFAAFKMSGGKCIPSALSSSSVSAGLGAASSAGIDLPPIKPSAPFEAPPPTPAAATAAAASSAAATTTATNQQLASEVGKTIPITCPDSVSATAVHKIALDLVYYGASCAARRRQPYAGRAYVVGIEEGLDELIPPTAGAVSGGLVAEGALGTTSGSAATTGRQTRKRGGAAALNL